METDWEVEIGGGAPVIEAHWEGFVDLRAYPERVWELAEAKDYPPIADFLLRSNSDQSPLWSSKCDVWQPELGGLACYVDLLPRDGGVFADWKHAETFCRDLLAKLRAYVAPAGSREQRRRLYFVSDHEEGLEGSVTLVIRQAVLEHSQGFGITAYFSAEDMDLADAEKALAGAMGAFANSLVGATFTEGPVQS